MQKTTLVPVHRTVWDLPPESRVDLGNGVFFENVENLLKPENFELWNQYVSEDDRKRLARVKFALVHHFESMDHVGPQEQHSIALMYRVFICLRLVRPTVSNWSNIQFKDTSEGIDVFAFSNPEDGRPLLPVAESYNEVNLDDIRRVGQLLQRFLRVVDKGPLNIRRAINYFELAYSEVADPTIQFVTWMMALEQFYSREEKPERRSVLLRRIADSINLDDDIYADTQFRSVFPESPRVTARETIQDLFVLRSRFVHGSWAKKEWLEPQLRAVHLPSSTYTDVLREVASWLVRKSIIHYLETASENI
jgi:Apea-like HEPN